MRSRWTSPHTCQAYLLSAPSLCTSFPASSTACALHHHADRLFDTNWWHYTPAWYKPKYVILAGLSFIISANLAATPGLKTTLMATVPVGFAWFLFLWMVPRQFREFAHKYVAAHPECEAKERERAKARAAGQAEHEEHSAHHDSVQHH